VDECFDQRIVEHLRAAGHDVDRVPTSSGLADLDVATIAEREMRTLLTQDLDFGRIAVQERKPATGVCIVRCSPAQHLAAAERLLALLGKGPTAIERRLTVIDHLGVRTREIA
jgi:predicted nuclease of predicted toxin-antitoxin system